MNRRPSGYEPYEGSEGLAEAPSVEPHAGVKPDPTRAPHIHVEERRVGEAPYRREESRTLDEEALDVGAFDVRHPKVKRPSLRVAWGATRDSLEISAAAHHRDGAA